ncbi:Uncharacterized protein APZ42_004932, partial [Daphnia magna]
TVNHFTSATVHCKQVPFKKFPGKIAAFLEIKFSVLYQHRGPERKNTPGRNSALATQHPILVYSHLGLQKILQKWLAL